VRKEKEKEERSQRSLEKKENTSGPKPNNKYPRALDIEDEPSDVGFIICFVCGPLVFNFFFVKGSLVFFQWSIKS
jgi:hypothetical protein